MSLSVSYPAPSTSKHKKLMVRFFRDGKKIKTIHFGEKGASDYTKHQDDDRKAKYIARHKARENWNSPMTAGALSRWILWNKTTLEDSFSDYLEKFNMVAAV